MFTSESPRELVGLDARLNRPHKHFHTIRCTKTTRILCKRAWFTKFRIFSHENIIWRRILTFFGCDGMTKIIFVSQNVQPWTHEINAPLKPGRKFYQYKRNTLPRSGEMENIRGEYCHVHSIVHASGAWLNAHKYMELILWIRISILGLFVYATNQETSMHDPNAQHVYWNFVLTPCRILNYAHPLFLYYANNKVIFQGF